MQLLTVIVCCMGLLSQAKAVAPVLTSIANADGSYTLNWDEPEPGTYILLEKEGVGGWKTVAPTGVNTFQVAQVGSFQYQVVKVNMLPVIGRFLASYTEKSIIITVQIELPFLREFNLSESSLSWQTPTGLPFAFLESFDFSSNSWIQVVSGEISGVSHVEQDRNYRVRACENSNAARCTPFEYLYAAVSQCPDIIESEIGLTTSSINSQGQFDVSWSTSDPGRYQLFEAEISQDTYFTGDHDYDYLSSSLSTLQGRVFGINTDMKLQQNKGSALSIFDSGDFGEDLRQVALGASVACTLDALGNLQCSTENSSTQRYFVDEIPGDIGSNIQKIVIQSSTTNSPAGCVIDSNGQVRCWGAFSSGITKPPVGFESDTKDIDIGGQTACAINSNGELKCWSSYVNREEVLEADAIALGAKKVVVGNNYGCVITALDKVACWGNDEVVEATPDIQGVRTLAAGGAHVCAIDETEQVHCWGMTLANSDALEVPIDLLPAKGILVGDEGSCAIDENSDIRCWGLLGHPTLESLTFFPIRFPKIYSTDVELTSISTSGSPVSRSKAPGRYQYRLVDTLPVDNSEELLPIKKTVACIETEIAPNEINLHSSPHHNSGVEYISWNPQEDKPYYYIEYLDENGNWARQASTTNWYKAVNTEQNYRVQACKTHLYDDCTEFSYLHEVEPVPSPRYLGKGFGEDEENIGSIDGQFRVDESGASTYSIPITTVAGVAGVVPQIALNYSSEAKFGIAGEGWSISGVSRISRCRQTLAADGSVKPIMWNEQDRFCLDGQKLLVLNGDDYGAVGARYKKEFDDFSTVTSVGGQLGAPDHFVLTKKDGSTSYFGNTIDSKLKGFDDTGNLSSNVMYWSLNEFQDNMGNPIIYSYLNDDRGQRLQTVEYAFFEGVSKANIEFDYSNYLNPLSSYVSGYEFRHFHTVLKTITSYNENNIIEKYKLNSGSSGGKTTSKLSRIESCDQNDICLPATKFTYTSSGAFEFGGTDTQAFIENTYTEMSPIIILRDLPGELDENWPDWESFAPIDINGDSFNEIVFTISRGSSRDVYVIGNNVGVLTQPVRVANYPADKPLLLKPLDYNADGKQDVALGEESGSIFYVLVSHKNEATGQWQLTKSLPSSPGGISVPIANFKNLSFVDIDTDGVVDLMSKDQYWLLEKNSNNPQETPYEFVLSGTSNLGSLDSAQVENLESSGCTFSSINLTEFRIIGDINSDGLMDYAYGHGENWNCPSGLVKRYSLGVYALDYDVASNLVQGRKVHAFQAPASSGDTKDKLAAIAPGNINKDGMTDIVYYENGWHFRLSKATEFGVATSISGIPLENGDKPGSLQLKLVDLNTDGYDDIFFLMRDVSLEEHRPHWDPIQAYVPRIKRNHVAYNNTFGVNDIPGAHPPSNDFPYMVVTREGKSEISSFADFTGDGYPDLLEAWVSYRSWGSEAPKGPSFSYRKGFQSQEGASKIKEIINGFGAKTIIEYDSLTLGGHYTADDDEVENFNDLVTLGQQTLQSPPSSIVHNLNTPRYVVKRVESSAPANGDFSAKSAISYSYSGAKVQLAGRGLLGFKTISTVDEQTGVRTTTEYRQDWPFIGYPLKTITESSQGNLLNTLENTWGFANCYSVVNQGSSSAEHIADTGCVSSMKSKQDLYGTAALGSIQPMLVKTESMNFNLLNNGVDQGRLISRQITRFDNDDYGNQVWSKEEYFDENDQLVQAKETIHQFGVDNLDIIGKEYGRLSRSIAITTRNGESYTRTASFDYYPASSQHYNMLKSETIEPDFLPVDGQENNLTLVTSHYYDAYGNKTHTSTRGWDGQAIVDRQGKKQFYEQGRYVSRITQKYPDGEEINLSNVEARNIFGFVTEVVNSDGVITWSSYTNRGRKYHENSSSGGGEKVLLSSSDPLCPQNDTDAEVIATAYVSTQVFAGGSQNKTCFDILGRVTRELNLHFDGTWIAVDSEYDVVGLLKRKSEPYVSSGTPVYWTVTDYDILGRPISISLPHMQNAITQSIQYDGFTTTTTQSATNISGMIDGSTSLVTTRITNTLGEDTEVIDPLNGILAYSYYPDGSLKSTTVSGHIDGGGSANGVIGPITTTLYYDKLGRKITMDDPDKGSWNYFYNAFGEMIEQQDANGNLLLNQYDILGRIIVRQNLKDNDSNPTTNDLVLEGDISWKYDSEHVGYGRSDFVFDSITGYRQSYSYDAYGRPSRTETKLGHHAGNTTYTTSVTYDQYGRIFQKFDASGDNWGARYRYNDFGYLKSITEAKLVDGSHKLYFTVGAMTPRGQVKTLIWGENTATSHRSYDPARGVPTSLVTHHGMYTVQDLEVDFDDFANLIKRINRGYGDSINTLSPHEKSLTETFKYDALNRLTETSLDGNVTQTQTYDSFGNIKTKSDVGTYSYGQIKTCSLDGSSANFAPHAVSAVALSDGGSESYIYDCNGNLLSNTSATGDRSFVYSSFNKVTQITKGNRQIDFAYSPSRSRYLRVDKNINTQMIEKTTYYMDSVEKIIHSNGEIEVKRYIDGQVLVSNTFSDASAQTFDSVVQYLIKDYLGSTELVINETPISLDGQMQFIAADFAFDAWGKRRKSNNWQSMTFLETVSFSSGVVANTTNRGFTGHEMLDDVGVIHMNGRIYDPRLGRFLQADPFIDGAGFTQGYNRYSYGANNPLSGVDPSGYGFLDIFNFVIDVVKIVAAVALTASGCIPCAAAVVGILSFQQVIVNGGSLGDAFKAGISSAALTYVGGTYAPGAGEFSIEYTLGMGVIGGITSVLQGGKFGHGFASAGIGAASGGIGFKGSYQVQALKRALVSSVIGGSMTKATGGKFANGAATAAFASLVSSAASKASELNQPNGAKADPSKGSIRSRQAAARKEIDALVTDGTLDTSKVFTGDSALNNAATEVLDAVHPISEKYQLEIGGKLVANGEGVSYSKPVVGLPGRVRIDATGALAGYHTHHGGHPATAFFSNQYNSGGVGDVGFTQAHGIDLYMSHQPAGTSTINISVCTAYANTCNPNFNPHAVPGFNYGVEGERVR